MTRHPIVRFVLVYCAIAVPAGAVIVLLDAPDWVRNGVLFAVMGFVLTVWPRLTPELHATSPGEAVARVTFWAVMGVVSELLGVVAFAVVVALSVAAAWVAGRIQRRRSRRAPVADRPDWMGGGAR